MSKGTLYGMVTVQSSANYTDLALSTFLDNTDLKPDDRLVLIDNDGHWTEFFPEWNTVDTHVNDQPKNTSGNINQLISLANDLDKDLVFLSNDVVFTREWTDGLDLGDSTISIPSCNQNIRSSKIPDSLSIQEFPKYLEELTWIAAKRPYNPIPMLLMPTYVCRIPQKVYQTVGLFDEAFNVGGEDVDYRIRALKAGFSTQYAKPYLLHFNGKSSWNGAETQQQTMERDRKYKQHFRMKWGTDLAALCLNGGDVRWVINKYPQIYPMLQANDFDMAILEVLKHNEPTN